jgi:uncharacterized delta-60 repeat protein
LTVAFTLGLLAAAPNAGAAPYPPTLALQPAFTAASVGTDGSILVNLEQARETSSERYSTVIRYLGDGQLDRSFRPERSRRMEVPEAIDSKGRTLKASARGGVERLNADGSVDAVFAPPALEPRAGEAIEFRIAAILPLASGRVAVAGPVLRRGEHAHDEIGVALYDESGLPDTTFGTNGIVKLGEDLGVEGEEFIGLTSGPSEDLLVSLNERDRSGGVPTPKIGSGPRVAAVTLKGKLDPSFSADGVYSSPDPIAAVAGMPDGGVLLAGTRWGSDMTRSRYARESDVYLERLTPQGVPDPSFGGRQGRTTVDLGGVDAANALLLRPDGSALVGGGITVPSPRCLIYEGTFCTEVAALAAFTATGDLDRAFGREGVVRFGSLAYEFAPFNRFAPIAPLGVLFLRELPLGGALVGGATEASAFLAEVGDEGRLQRGFGEGGTVTRTNPREATTELRAMVVDQRGGILISGSTDAAATWSSGAVFRFRADGAGDRGFARGQGYVRVSQPPTTSESLRSPHPAGGLALDAHGRALALGGAEEYERPTVTRIGVTGRPDRRFGIDGIAPLPRYVWARVEARQRRLNLLPKLLTALPGGGILVFARAGYDNVGGPYPALIRLTSRGGLDRSFGHRGVAVMVRGIGRDFEVTAMLALPGGKILLGGADRSRYPGRRAALMRLRSDGSLDASFGQGGVSARPSPRWGEAITSMVPGPGGEIIASAGTWTRLTKAGRDTVFLEDLPVIERFSARGRLDREFGRRAIRTLPSPGRGSLARAERVILWRDQVLVSGRTSPGQRVFGTLVYTRDGRFVRRLVPRREPAAGQILGTAVQEGKPVVVTTTHDSRALAVRPLVSAGRRR